MIAITFRDLLLNCVRESGWEGGWEGGCEPEAALPPPAASVLELRQQLAAANHRAARLQIELDAAVAKLSRSAE